MGKEASSYTTAKVIAGGLDVVFVAAQMGRSDPSITLRVYGYMFDRAKHAEKARSVLDGILGRASSVSSALGNAAQVSADEAGGNVASLHEIGNTRQAAAAS